MLHEEHGHTVSTADQALDRFWSKTSDLDGPVVSNVQLELDDRTISLARVLMSGACTILHGVVWSRIFNTRAQADDAYSALRERQGAFGYWSVGVLVMGPEWLNPTTSMLIEEYIDQREQKREALARELETEREKLDREQAARTVINAYFIKQGDRFAITLERGSPRNEKIWSITFDEAWERDRFWDWLGWQRNRFDEFAEYMLSGSRLELERQLLREMLATERDVKKQGLGSGGRRPLRFWRGEL
ncbi:hypothetical protein [Sphingomonas sp. PP-CC-3G-468]|uniref:hypothetical protein n=1 Tax=Sphingomonas sp. PP-CC-3G-468 TaxID=2135656 RepID=UPI0010429F7B|nr:hypothetical protein [Sphingomonas sp. PP-CC-3G-468]TCM07342.1 hypothetical protein C8J41_103250 [Sphingomonas sp. PP-CC-3G-468]